LADGFTGCCAPVDFLISSMNVVKDAARAHGRDVTALQFVMRCLVTHTEQPIEGANRAVATGSWEQIREDVRKLSEAGVDEAFFDVSFQPGVTDFAHYLRYLREFRSILGAELAV
jgi:hypothetical protein